MNWCLIPISWSEANMPEAIPGKRGWRYIVLIAMVMLLIGLALGFLLANYFFFVSAPKYVTISGSIETTMYEPDALQFAIAGENCSPLMASTPQCGNYGSNITVSSKSLVTHPSYNGSTVGGQLITEGTPGTYSDYTGKYSVTVTVPNNQWYVLGVSLAAPNNTSLGANAGNFYLDSVTRAITGYNIYCSSSTVIKYNYTTYSCFVTPG